MNTSNDNIAKQAIKRITCEELETFIIDFIDERLSDEQQKICNTHLEECEHCKTYIAKYRQSIELSQIAFQQNNSANSSIKGNEIPEELVQAILKANKNNK
jgi:anti-sigma factor RsiW